MIVVMHASIRHFGIGPLFIFLGSIQFFQTILAGNVYNIYFNEFVFSPGSTLLYTSTLFCVLLIFHTENIKKTRSLLYGLVFSNIVITVLSYISLEQVFIDQYSINTDFLKHIFNFDISLFLIGTSLLYIDSILLIIFYEFLNYTFPKKYLLLKLLLVTSCISLLDSFIFYTLNFYTEEDYSVLLLGNIVGKQIAVLFFSLIIFYYLKIIGKPYKVLIPKNRREIVKIFSF